MVPYYRKNDCAIAFYQRFLVYYYWSEYIESRAGSSHTVLYKKQLDFPMASLESAWGFLILDNVPFCSGFNLSKLKME